MIGFKGSNEKVSQAWFEQMLFPVIRAAARIKEDSPADVLSNMIRMWTTDVMNGADLNKLGWWAEAEAWANKRGGRDKAVMKFMCGLLDVFMSVIKDYSQNMPAMVAQFAGNMALRYSEIPKYYDFIQTLQRKIWAEVPTICFIGGHASGDMFGIGASALLKPDMNIVVYRADKIEQDHSDGMFSFFSELLGPGRVWLSNSSWEALDRDAPSDGVYAVMRSRATFAWLAPYNMGTYFLRDQFQLGDREGLSVENRTSIRKSFHVEWLKRESELRGYLENLLGGPSVLAGRKLLVLWSRFTGKKGEYHPEHDTSFRGIAQMAWLAAELGYSVIIAGDRPIVHERVSQQADRRRKYDDIVAALNKCYGETRCFNLTEFWTELAWKSYSGGKRVAQFQLYELLHRMCDVRHLGMRSGNLEALALLGYFVRYMEEEKSYGGDRMMAWHGTGLRYERILLTEPPTRVGKYVHYDLKLNVNGLFKMGVLQASMPPYITARNRGFPGTASRDKPTVNAALQQKREYQQTELSRIPAGLTQKREELQKKQEEALTQLEQAMTQESLKPEAVAKYASGFVDEDLKKILEFLREENPCLGARAPSEPTAVKSGDKNLVHAQKQRQILGEIQRLIVQSQVS